MLYGPVSTVLRRNFGELGALSAARQPRSGEGARDGRTGDGGYERGAPHDVAVVGVTGRLAKNLPAISMDGAVENAAGEGGNSEGAPQLVAVVGVGGTSSIMRHAISGEGSRDIYETGENAS